MKKVIILALVAVLTLGLMAGCRSRGNVSTTAPTTMPTTTPTTTPTTAPTTVPTTAPTTAPTTEATEESTDMMPDVEDMIPGPEDTVDPSSGANNETEPARRRHMGF